MTGETFATLYQTYNISCTVLTIAICGTPATSHQTVLHHTIRIGVKMHQYYVSRLVVLDREEGLVDNRKRAELYYWQRWGQARGHFDPGCQVYSSQSCLCLPLHWMFQQRFCWIWIDLFLADKPLVLNIIPTKC